MAKKMKFFLFFGALLASSAFVGAAGGIRIWNPYFGKCLGLGRTKQHAADGSTTDFIKKGPGARLELEDCAFDSTAENQLFVLSPQVKDIRAEDTGDIISARVFWMSTADHSCVAYDDTKSESLLYSYEPTDCATSNATFLFFTSGHKAQGVQLALARLYPLCLAALPDQALGIRVVLRECVEQDGQYWQFCNYQLNSCSGIPDDRQSKR